MLYTPLFFLNEIGKITGKIQPDKDQRENNDKKE